MSELFLPRADIIRPEDFDWSRCATVPRNHQKDGVIILSRDVEPERHRIIPRAFLLADQVGAGKSKQVVDTGEVLYEQRRLDTMVIVAPAFARGVWADPDPRLGEIAKHGWPSVPNYVMEYSVRHDRLTVPAPVASDLLWVVTNYEFIRRKERLAPLISFLRTRKFWLVCDEAWMLTSHTTAQWKAVYALRRMADRVTLLNGSPSDSPLDLFAQMRMLDHSILESRIRHPKGYMMWSGYTHFRARYAMLQPLVDYPMVIGWQNLEELREKVAPYVLRRTTRECWDLPPILDPVMIEAKLTESTWKLYRSMRDDMIAWLGGNEASIAKQAIVKGLRLAQITSGFLGGVQTVSFDDPESFDFEDGLPGPQGGTVVKEIGREKLDALIAWLETLNPIPHRYLIWAWFRPEIERTAEALQGHQGRTMFKLYGQQSRDDRDAAVRALNPDIEPTGRVGVVGQPQAGGASLNLAGAPLAIRLSRTSSLRAFNQANGRSDRPGLREPLCYMDVVATGPKGQRTIDHHILAALRAQQDVAEWTAATWRKKLLEE